MAKLWDWALHQVLAVVGVAACGCRWLATADWLHSPQSPLPMRRRACVRACMRAAHHALCMLCVRMFPPVRVSLRECLLRRWACKVHASVCAHEKRDASNENNARSVKR